MGKFRQILTELSAQATPKFSFPDNNLSKCQGILTKLATCIDMKEIWFRIANGQFRQYLTDNLPMTRMAGHFTILRSIGS